MTRLSNWRKNKIHAIFINTEPTLTDQSSARDTDINVIVAQFGIHGQVPQGAKPPIYGDFTEHPESLRETIEMSRRIQDHRQRLPDALKNLSLEELLALTPETLREKLKEAEEAAKPTDEPK